MERYVPSLSKKQSCHTRLFFYDKLFFSEFCQIEHQFVMPCVNNDHARF